MKRPSRKSARANAGNDVRLWTQSQVRAAAPYLASVLRSLREQALAVQAGQQRLRRLQERPGRPSRSQLIAQEETQRELDQSRRHLSEAAHELEEIGALPLDTVQGLLLLPFHHKGQLAWYIFDLYDSNPVRWWRYSEDPEEQRRPLTSAQSGLIEV